MYLSRISLLSNGNAFTTFGVETTQLNDRGTVEEYTYNAEKYYTAFIFQLSNGTVLAAGKSDTSVGRIFALNNDCTINTGVGNKGILADQMTGIAKVITQLKDKTVLVGTSEGYIYKLTEEGKIDTSAGESGVVQSGFDGSLNTIKQLKSGVILAGTSAGSIYQLNPDGTINTSAGNHGKLEEHMTSVNSITELSNGVILAGTGDEKGSIYKLTPDGKIDTSVGKGTGRVEDYNFHDPIVSIISMSNVYDYVFTSTTIFAITSAGKIDHTLGNDGIIGHTPAGWIQMKSVIKLNDGSFLFGSQEGSIYKLTSDGQIDTSVGNNGQIEDKVLDGRVTSLVQLSDGTILAGTTIINSTNQENLNGSIYKLTPEGKIDTSIGGGAGKVLNQVFNGGIKSIIELSNKTILIGTANYSIDKAGHIYKLVL